MIVTRTHSLSPPLFCVASGENSDPTQNKDRAEEDLVSETWSQS